MDSRRLFRLITRRWWLITIVAVAGAAAGFLFTERQNESIENTFEATAPVLILQTHSESDDAYETRLRSLESGARLALATQISGSDIFSVGANVGLGRLEFEARAATSDRAIELAEQLRDLYEAAEPAADTIGQLQERLNSLALEIQSLRAERARLTAGSPIDPGVAAELALMEAQLSSLRQRVAALNLGVLVPGLGTAVDELGLPRPVDEVQAELLDLQIVLRQLEEQYEELRAENPTAIPDQEENLDLLVLDQKIRDAESLYISNSLTIEELLNGGGTSLFRTDTAVADVTPLPSSALRMGVLGLLLGGALAMGAIIGADRMRRPVLGLEDDLSLQVLANVDPVRPGAFDDRAWYPSADDARRSDVQGLRAALENVTSRGTSSIALAGLGTSDSAVQELAADLATSIAAADRKVLLVDAIFAKPSSLPEYSSPGPTLADIVTRRETSADAWEELKQILDERDEVLPELLALPAGTLEGDPVDAVAGRRFRELLEVAKEFVEVVIVAAPGWGDSATDVLTQRLDNFVLVGRLGTTPAVDIDDAANELATRGASALGLVLLRRRSQLRGTIREQQVRRGRARSQIEPGPAAAVPPASPDEPAGYVEPPPLQADPFDHPAPVTAEDGAADEQLLATDVSEKDLPEETENSDISTAAYDRSEVHADEAPALDEMVGAAAAEREPSRASEPASADIRAVDTPIDASAEGSDGIFSAGLAGATPPPPAMHTFSIEESASTLETEASPSFEPLSNEPEETEEIAAPKDKTDSPLYSEADLYSDADSFGETAIDAAPEGAIRPEIVSPKSASTDPQRPVDHISEIHIADEADVIDTVAVPRDPTPGREPVTTSQSERLVDDLAEGGEPVTLVSDPPPLAPPEPLLTAEPVVAPEPVTADEPVVAPEPLLTAEPVVAPEPVTADEPVVAPEPAASPTPE
ncbi:MAG: hypothetical protein HKN91_16600, partial [Acidimicrobiia bacterium]|nr:hypothetical protein [Acidimicrobiia bacterium]